MLSAGMDHSSYSHSPSIDLIKDAYNRTAAVLEFSTWNRGVGNTSVVPSETTAAAASQNAVQTTEFMGIKDEEKKPNPTLNITTDLWTRPLVTPGSLCSLSTAFFQPPNPALQAAFTRTTAAKRNPKRLHNILAAEQLHPSFFAMSPRRYRSHSDPTLTVTSSSHLPPHHRSTTTDSATTLVMEDLGVEPSILRSPFNLVRSIDLLEKRLVRGGFSDGNSTTSTSVATGNISTADPWSNDEASSVPQCELPIITQLASIIFGDDPTSTPPTSSHEFMNQLFDKASTPRRVCQHPFRKNDIVWVCRTCQSDETCVLCHQCFTRSNHEGHDVAFYHAQAGGCCDCGDPDAWDSRGFCDLHGCGVSNTNSNIDSSVVARTRGVVLAVLDWFTHVIAEDVENTFYPTTAMDSINGTSTPTADESSLPPDVFEDLNRSLILESNGGQASFQHPMMDIAMSGETKSFHSSLSNNLSIDTDGDEQSDNNTDAASIFDFDTNHQDSIDGFSNIGSMLPTSILTTTPYNVQEQPIQQHLLPSILSIQAESPTKREASKAHHEQFDRRAHALGESGRTQGGLYLIIFSQDAAFFNDMQGSSVSDYFVSSLMEVLGAGAAAVRNASSNSSYVRPILRLCKQFGEISILGTSEIISAVGVDTAFCWRDGDALKTTLVGKWILDQCLKLTSKYWNVAIKTHAQMLREQRASAILALFGLLSRASDALCQTMAEAISGRQHLVALLTSDLMLPRHLTKRWHALLLTLLAVPRFKMELAEAYCVTYGEVTKDYARGIGVSEASSFTLSVQFLNRQTYVRELAAHWVLLQRLTSALLNTLKVALRKRVRKIVTFHNASSSASAAHQVVLYEDVLDPEQPVLMQRRYSPCISDIKCVLNVQGMPRLFASMSLFTFLQTLTLSQGMDKQSWRNWSMHHVETDPRGWVGAFNCSISLGSIYERMLSWNDDSTNTESIMGFSGKTKLLTCSEICDATWCAVSKWQKREMKYYQSTGNSPTLHSYECSSAALSYSKVHCAYGTEALQQVLPVSQVEPWSFHYPLHRFFSICLRELCRRSLNTNDLASWLKRHTSLTTDAHVWRTIVEFPVLALSRAAQIRCNLWRRNGSSMIDQVLNYAEPPFCRSLRDADFGLIQFATVALNISPEIKGNSCHNPSEGTAFLINLLLHRFGIFDFAGFTRAPRLEHGKTSTESSEDTSSPDFSERNEKALIPRKPTSDFSSTYNPSQGDAVASLSLLEELFNTVIILITELPSPAPMDQKSQVDQAKHRLRREIVHRLVSGPKTHSELIEVHQVLPMVENSTLAEEGKRYNPNDAGGALLELILLEVAERKPSSGFDPDQWILKREAYSEYDPSFYHISPRSHQNAVENKSESIGNINGADQFTSSTSYAPRPSPAHPFLKRLRKDLTADSATIALIYRTLHIHFCNEFIVSNLEQSQKEAKEKPPYELDCMSESCLARSVHLLTLGTFCWEEPCEDIDWVKHGGGGVGSIFHGRMSCPGPQDYVEGVMLKSPDAILQSNYVNEADNILILLHRLASKGVGRGGSFVVQDSSLRSGAAWLCKYAARHHQAAAEIVEGAVKKGLKNPDDLERRKQEAKERALMKMKGYQAKFIHSLVLSGLDRSGMERIGADQESLSSEDSKADKMEDLDVYSDVENYTKDARTGLLNELPRCIICNEDGPSTSQETKKDPSGDHSDALAFCAFAQASMVLKGCGEPIRLSPATKFSSVHVSLCGHAIHSSCCNAYLASTSMRDSLGDPGSDGEFRCPLCKRFSNCLVPFVDVDKCWIESPQRDEHLVGQNGSSLHCFLSSDNVLLDRSYWDGRSKLLCCESEKGVSEDNSTDSNNVYRRRRFGKKDLWSLVMRPARRKKKSLSASNSSISQEIPNDEYTGISNVFRKLSSHLTDIAHKADVKRVHEHKLTDFGEFRHHLTEQLVYNLHGRNQILSPISEWPACILERMTADQEQELEQEKMCSELLFSIQCFAYSCCAETYDIRREYTHLSKATQLGTIDENYLSKYGIADIQYNGMLVLMPTPTLEDGGVHAFDGRLGKLRYLALALISASRHLWREIIQLSFSFPFRINQITIQNNEAKPRAPITYPILFGHAFSHTVAALCACSSIMQRKATGRENSSDDAACDMSEYFDATKNCKNFIKLGFIARVLQVLLGSLNIFSAESADEFRKAEECTYAAADTILASRPQSLVCEWDDRSWEYSCAALISVALSNSIPERVLKNGREDKRGLTKKKNGTISPSKIEMLKDACLAARIAGETFLADAAVVLQIVTPGISLQQQTLRDGFSSISSTVQGLCLRLQIESLPEMLQSTRVQSLIESWYSEAKSLWHSSVVETERSEISQLLKPVPEVPVFDWPLFVHEEADNLSACRGMNRFELAQGLSKLNPLTVPEASSKNSPWEEPFSSTILCSLSSPAVSSSKTCVPLIGVTCHLNLELPMWREFCIFDPVADSSICVNGGHTRVPPRIKMLPSSYTDLYAQLSSLLPESEQTAVCLVCGTVLNAGGKGACTKHAMCCGAGCGLFFLLQECVGLIMHGKKAAYVHSPYVDAHGETPQFRGRPLNLDMDRYDILREMWTSHSIRQKVMAERAVARQVIIAGYY